ncbi:hypothetical protein D0N36_02075 [Hymenobacter lapidiphilus]|uniref:cold-shock protein n=1 Tax=Hymenobacter sp. CCM 8763 TaxID=2303334 RepID=UPI000E34F997|nr:cold shock domain-containing protein [Hymenobacter sp. CCM 8763]RFP66893.1 hypothetical protein D0N36_02075 [Hymenobacter sp. CCM 8763]
MENSYNGIVIFFRSKQQGAGFGFIYSPELDKTFHFNERVLASSDYQVPHVGDSVSFEEGIYKGEGKGPTASIVRSSQTPHAIGAVIRLSAVADVYRHPVSQLSRLLGNQQQVNEPLEFVTIQQLLAVSELVAKAKESGKSEREPVIRHIGKVVRYKEESGYGFIEQDGFDDVFVHVNSAAPNTLETGAWVVFTQSVSPKDPAKLRATNVKGLASEVAYLRANLRSFTEAKLQILLEHGPESLRAAILNRWFERIDHDSTFEQAQQVIELVQQYLPQDVARYQETIGQRLAGEAAWYWWQRHGLAEVVPEEVLNFYKEAAPELTGSADYGFDLRGTLLLKHLPLPHFKGFFSARWSYARVLESVETESGKRLLDDCRYLPALDGFGYEAAILNTGDEESTQKAMWLVRYLASLEITGLAELVWQALHLILPIPAFVVSLSADTPADHLMPLLAYGIPEIDAVVAPQLFQELGTVDTEDNFVQLVKLLKLCQKTSNEALAALATELALHGCSTFFQVKLWTLGLIPSADIRQLLEALPSSEITLYLQDAYAPVRLPAAFVLMLRIAETGDDASIRQGVGVLRKSRQLLTDEDFEQLLQVYPAVGGLYLEVNGWLENQQLRPAYTFLLAWLLVLREQAPAEMMPLIALLAQAEKAEMLHHVVDIDPARLLGLDSAFLSYFCFLFVPLPLFRMKPLFYLGLALSLAACSTPSSETAADAGVLAHNDFESLAGWLPDDMALTKDQAHSGKYATMVDQNHEFSLTYNTLLGNLSEHKPRGLMVEAWVYLPDDKATASWECK